ncbi:hypothetical protein [Amycolatopsis albispora]|uniref:Uncharacterized protein n=1 Tax=Amycolatopsis albispora TaxID=1804986 RepID=A0A344L071_9PSEU|nr:hypothetical protein [Amycolatopsis albispora]AXB41445.1 hypothetical protein A4R43_01985 [Amycolatopsis albispora]
MRKLVLGGLAVLVLACAGCGVSTQDRPEKLPSLTRMPDPTPSVTQVPEHEPAPGSSGSRQVPPPVSTTG